MNILDSHSVLIFLSLTVILSYWFNLLGRHWRLPSVLLLLGFGILLHSVGDYFNFVINDIKPYLELFGIVGLILIVLEAALDIKISASSLPNIRKSFEVAFLMLVLGTVSIAALFNFWFGTGWKVSLINSIPLAVVSSAIVIPSVAHLSGKKKEFLIYESTLSDILGILFFNFLVQQTVMTAGSILSFFMMTGVTVILSFAGAVFLIFLAARIKNHVKMFIILSIMLLIYSLGKMLHLSSLLLIFIFGILVNNLESIFKNKFMSSGGNEIKNELVHFKLVVSESSFVIRTFFFIMFGYSIDLRVIVGSDVLLIGSLVVMILVAVRYLYLRLFAKFNLLPEFFVAPKGLVSILLFYAIPAQSVIPFVGRGVLFFVICATSVFMAVGLYIHGGKTGSNDIL
ncbi:MAG: cation:proton antiporter [Candidatus Omnitrophota bacterium]|jgi:Kef-type K+ transport system membrane component KefB